MLLLAYCGMEVADVAAWKQFAVKALGLMPVDHRGALRLRIDDQAWRFSLAAGPRNDIVYVGLECADAGELADLRDKLSRAGISCDDLSTDEIVDRQVETGFHIADPGGLRIEVVTGQARASTPFSSALVDGFRTGDQGLGHVVLATADLDAAIAFYRYLGFEISDFITAPFGEAKLRIAFLHCNSRHHTLAMAALPGEKRLNHILIEVNQVDDVLLAHRRCTKQGYSTGGLGRHPNDRMLSFYVQAPSGFDIELGWGGLEIHGAWEVSEFDRISIWGHERAS